MQPLIFLDIDGVLNSQHSNNELINEYEDYFDYCSSHSTFDERVVDAESIICK